jgi:hypothetical protein
MPRLHIDASEAQSMKPIPEDTYPCTVLSVSEAKQGPNATYVEAVLVVSEGEYEGRKLYRNMPIEGKGAGIFIDFISKVTGEDYDIDDLDELDIDTDDLEGQEVGAVVTQREYPEGSGEFRNEVSRIVAAE